MANGVAVVHKQVKRVELFDGRGPGRLEIVDEAEAQAPEVVAERGASGVVGIQFPTPPDEQVERLLLPRDRGVDVNSGRLVVEVSTEALELGDQRQEQASVELGRAPPTPRTGARQVGVDCLQLSQASKPRATPLIESRRASVHAHQTCRSRRCPLLMLDTQASQIVSAHVRVALRCDTATPDAPGVSDLAEAFLARRPQVRRGELSGLRRNRLRLDRNELVVDTAINDAGGIVVEKSTKTKRNRCVSLDPVTIGLLRQHLADMDQRAATCGVTVAEDGFVFSLDPTCRTPMRPELMTRRMRQLRKALGIRPGEFDATILALRKWTSTELMDAGFNPSTVSGRQGHTVQVMLQHYSSRRRSADQAAAQHLGNKVHGPQEDPHRTYPWRGASCRSCCVSLRSKKDSPR